MRRRADKERDDDSVSLLELLDETNNNTTTNTNIPINIPSHLPPHIPSQNNHNNPTEIDFSTIKATASSSSSTNEVILVKSYSTSFAQGGGGGDVEKPEVITHLGCWETIKMFFFPKIQPLPCLTFFELMLVCFLPAMIYILFFTKMGFGLVAFYYLSQHYKHVLPGLATGLVVWFLILYLFDFSYWGRSSRIGLDCYYIAWLSLFSGIAGMVLLFTDDHPYGPICLFAVMTPVVLTIVKRMSFPNQEIKVYISWLSGPLFLVSCLTAVGWTLWTFLGDDNEWNDVNRVRDSDNVGCEPNFEKYPECSNNGQVCFAIENTAITFPPNCPEKCIHIYDNCLNTFIVWVGPLLVSAYYFFLSFFCTFLRNDAPDGEVINFAKLWILLLFGMWCTASLVGAGDGVTSALAAFTLTSFIGSFVFLGASYSRDEQRDRVMEVWHNITHKYEAYLDVVKGLLVLTVTPIFMMYMVLSFVNQCVRKCNFPCSKKLMTDEDIRGWVTKRCRRQINEFRTWNHGKVFTYAIYWGMGFLTLQVVIAQFTLLFLSWLIDFLSKFSLGEVTCIMFVVGLIMFLLPPIPGVPIYLTMGIVIVAAGYKQLGFAGAIFYSNFVSLIMKLVACTIQQKGIGENLSKSVSVRQMCQMNSRMIRVIRLILVAPRLSMAKVAILVGGPDWPTSVLCGIMRLPLLQILIGTIPVLIIVVPTVLTGSFTYMSSLRDPATNQLLFPWARTMATAATAVSGIVQFCTMVTAAYFIEKVAKEKAEELEQLPIDEEVRRADEVGEERKVIYNEVTQWDAMPAWARYMLVLSLGFMIVAFYTVQMFQDKCFSNYELTYTIEEHLDGDWTNLVLPMGRLAILFLIISSILLYVFIQWAQNVASKKQAEERRKMDAMYGA